MKKIYLLLGAVCSIAVLQAQTKEGTIIYERKINMHKMMQDEQMRAMMPEFRISKHMLLFSDSTSIYKAVPEDEAPDPIDGGGGGPRVIMRFGNDGGELYKNFATSKSIELRELGAKFFIIEDSIKTQKWKLSDETKNILGHLCHKATTQQTQMMAGAIRITTNVDKADTAKQKTPQLQTKQVDVVAWYADDIQTPVGPENNGGLPGVILQLSVDNEQTTYTATEIKKEVNKKELKEPVKGKKVTRQEFQKLAMEMMSNMNGGGMRRM
jgi:GLPGLI family protein